jgi:hypothetical protein
LYLERIEWLRFPGREKGGIVSFSFNQRLRSVARCAADGDAVAARSLCDDLIGKSASSALSDDALVSHAAAMIRRNLEGPITLAAVAKAAPISSPPPSMCMDVRECIIAELVRRDKPA